jgi:hypothetical protein
VIQFSIPDLYPEQLTCHDLDLVAKGASEITEPGRNLREEPTAELRAAHVVGERRIDLRSRRWIEFRKHKRWIGFDEYCAYLHSTVDATTRDGLRVVFEYDPHYCRRFAERPSSWTLEVSNRLRRELGAGAAIVVDGEIQAKDLAPKQTVTIAAGVGSHILSVLPE